MEFKEIDLNAPIMHYTKHLKDTIEQQEAHIKAQNEQIESLNIQNAILKNKISKIKNFSIIKILLKMRRVFLNFLGPNK